MREKFYRFMQGRYGNDALNQFLVVIILLCLGLSFFFGNIFYVIGLVGLFYMYFRMFSKNIAKRSTENQAYLKVYDKIRFSLQKRFHFLKQSKTHHIYKCPTCQQKIRVPRGKGRISIHCPKCGNEFVKKS
jgi:DNA-directed RNA polymerase subunit RPC12/RpoP